MNPPAEHDARELTPLDALLSPDERRLAVALEPGPLPWPEALTDNIRELERPFQAPTRRKEKDVHRVLTILDELKTKGGTE